MTFLFDACVSSNLVAILKLLGVDALHLHDRFSPDTPDPEWLPEVGRKGWVLVTADGRINRNPAERQLLREAGMTTFFLVRDFPRMTIFEQVSCIAKWWPRIAAEAAKNRPGTHLRVNRNGSVEVLTS